MIEDEPLPRPFQRLVARPVLRAAALWWRGRRYERVVLLGTGTVFKVYVTLDRLFPRARPHLVLLEYIVVPGGGLKHRCVHRLVVAPALRRSLLAAHTLSSWECERNAELLGVETERCQWVSWPLSLAGDSRPPDGLDRGRRVLASGRSLSDWPTVFAAAEGQDWELEIVCDRAALPSIERLNRDGRARVHCEVPLEEYRKMVGEFAVFLLAVPEIEASSGQIRVMDAARAGTPLVTANVRGLADYVSSQTALLFPPGDAHAARRCVNRLLDDPGLGERLRDCAFEHAQRRTREGYLAGIQRLIGQEAPDGG